MVGYEKIVSIIFAAITIGLLIAHYVTSETRTGISIWLQYGMLLFSAYILIAWFLNWTIVLPYGGSADTSDRSGRIFALIIGLTLFTAVIYNLFKG